VKGLKAEVQKLSEALEAKETQVHKVEHDKSKVRIPIEFSKLIDV